jgi:hypothetical protein
MFSIASSRVERLLQKKKRRFWDISTSEDEDTTLPRNDGIRLPTDAAAYHL